MTNRKRDGATLALVIILAFVLIIVGGCFFVWQLLIGGGKELQHATDSGNLNVAKQALITPDVVVPSGIDPTTNTDLRKEFQDVLDPGFKVNLLNFNRLVAKAVLAQLNAKSQGTEAAKNNAIQLTNAVYKLGQQLQANLSASSSLKGQFEQVSNSNSVRMLQHPTAATPGQAVSHRDAEYATSYMARNKASNVFFDKNAFPPGAQLADSDMTSDAGNKNKTFLKGYSSISSAGGLNGCPATWAVPLRPGEQPHLVSVDDFTTNQNPPFGPNTVPNSFRSGGSASFIRTGSNVELRSCAIVGVLERIFPAENPGTIIIDNSGLTFTGDIDEPGSSSLFAPGGKLMAPKGVEVFSVTALQGTFPEGTTRKYMAHFDPPNDSQMPSAKIIAQHQSTQTQEVLPTPASPYSDARTYPDNMPITGVDFWAMKMDGQGRYVSQYPERNQIMGAGGGAPGTSLPGIATKVQHIALCNGSSFEPNGQPAGEANPPECNKTKAFAALCNGQLGVPGGGSSKSFENLMPLEQYILTIKGGFGGGAGCVMVPALGPVGSCGSGTAGSGMKHVDPGRTPPFDEGTLGQLLVDTGAPSTVRTDMEARIRQIVPNSDPGTIFNNPVPFNKILYIHKNSSGELVMNTSKPSTLQYDYASQPSLERPRIINNIPDGDPVSGSNTIHVSGTDPWVPFFMWECGTGQATGQSNSVMKWYPSSGKGGLLGILKLNNCPEAGGPDWCCP